MITLTQYADYLNSTPTQKAAITSQLREKSEDVKMMYMTRSEFLAGGKDIKGTQVCVVPDGMMPEEYISKMEATEAKEVAEVKDMGGSFSPNT